MALGIVFAVTISHEVQKHIEVFQTQRRLLLGDLFAGVGGVVARAADKVHPPPDIRAYNVPEVLGIHQAHKGILIGHDQTLIDGVHPFHGELHRPAAVQDAGSRVDLIDALCSYSWFRKKSEILFFCEEIKVGHRFHSSQLHPSGNTRKQY